MAAGLDAATVADWVQRTERERTRRAPPPGFPQLPDIAGGRYSDAGFFAQEQAAVWRRCWLYAAHVDQLPEAGSYVLWTYGSAPIVILRGDDGVIRAFYNTCRHRGAPIVRDHSGRAGRTLVCGYHGWSYDRAGRLRAMTETRDWAGGVADSASCRDLVPVRCEQFANWVFVCEDASAGALEDFLEPVMRYLRHLPLDELRLVNRRALDVKCNARILIDNFLEAYHFKLLHPRTTDRIFDNQGTSIFLWANGHSMMLSPNRRTGWIDPGAVGMPEMATSTAIERDYNPSYCVFPNLIVPVATSGMPCVAIWPRTLTTSSMEVLWFAPDWGGGARDPLWDTRIKNFDRIVDEDIQLAEPMQTTVFSPGFRGVPLSYQERRIYHWHEEVDRRIGREAVAPELRVEPLLAPFVE